MKTVSREQARERINNQPNLTVVEVLDQEEFSSFHLPRAEFVPLGNQFDEQIEQKIGDKSRPALLSCKNSECPAFEKAAARTNQPGYGNVYDYEAGKVD